MDGIYTLAVDSALTVHGILYIAPGKVTGGPTLDIEHHLITLFWP